MPKRVMLALGACLAVILMATPASGNSPGDARIFTSSETISVAQGVLEHEGYLASGSYQRGHADDPTVQALSAFQINHTLVPTGLLDEETLTQILSHSGQMDADRDGVSDDLDRCPNTATGTDVDSQGCPLDSDKDSVSDRLDRCPDTASGARVDAEGCPLDGDRDAVYDGLDRCPDTPSGARVDSDGCPLDGDRDAVYDGLDRCPDTTRGVRVDSQGCEIEKAAKPAFLFQEKKQLVLQGVNFDTNTATLTADSRVVLDRVAESLKGWPDTQVEIAGFADSTNTDAYNLRLSRLRAEAVRAYLVNAGVAGAQVVAKGYGESRPIADNSSAAGRAENRRVEIAQID